MFSVAIKYWRDDHAVSIRDCFSCPASSGSFAFHRSARPAHSSDLATGNDRSWVGAHCRLDVSIGISFGIRACRPHTARILGMLDRIFLGGGAARQSFELKIGLVRTLRDAANFAGSRERCRHKRGRYVFSAARANFCPDGASPVGSKTGE